MRPDLKVELTSNITEDTILDEPSPVLTEDQKLGQDSKQEPESNEEETIPGQRMLEAIMGFAGGEGWINEDRPDKVWNTDLLDDPLPVLSFDSVANVMKQRVDDTLWEEEDIKPEEAPE